MTSKTLAAAALLAALTITGCTTQSTVRASSAPASPAAAASTAPAAVTPTPARGQTTAPGAASGIVAEAKAAIGAVAVKGRAPKTGYSRDQFGAAWTDTDHNGCDQRNDVLRRDLVGVAAKAGTKDCVIASGVLHDPYTAKDIKFTRGADSGAVQIDHVYPLSLAWQQGAQQWSAAQRLQFANDFDNLMAADGPTNGAKGDSGPGSWLPPNKAFRCTYVAKFTMVAAKYSLSMNPGDHDAAASILAGC